MPTLGSFAEKMLADSSVENVETDVVVILYLRGLDKRKSILTGQRSACVAPSPWHIKFRLLYSILLYISPPSPLFSLHAYSPALFLYAFVMVYCSIYLKFLAIIF